MCGRYNLRATTTEIQAFFDLFRGIGGDWQPCYNIAPTQTVLAVREVERHREAAPLRWGLIPSWSKNPLTDRPLFNARGETIAEKPSFRTAFSRRRCLIPANGFYEWQKTTARQKQPFHLHMADDGLFAMAGLWERWDKGGNPIESCTIVTTAPNELLAEIHDRMPVILHPADYGIWLDTAHDDKEELLDLLVPYPADEMIATPISTTINNARHDSAECIRPTSTHE